MPKTGAGFKVRATIERRNVSQQIRDALCDQILQGAISPGTKLVEDALAKEFRVSRSPVREAIAQLKSDGFVEADGPRDRRVKMLTGKVISDVYQLWIVLEVGRCYLSSLAATPEDHARLLELVDLMDAQGVSEDDRSLEQYAREFHRLLVARCENQEIQAIYDRLEKYLEWFEAVYLEKRLYLTDTSRREHRELAKCYAKQDLNGIANILWNHINQNRERILSALSGDTSNQ